MEINDTKYFLVTDKENTIGIGKIEDILTNIDNPEQIDFYVFRFDNGDVKCLNLIDYTFEQLNH